MRIVTSPFTDVGTHLAIEEALLDEAEGSGPALLLYRNRRAVVFGKNQNAWREARPGLLAAEGIAAARRSSGGGTVYHDEGNLNYSLILPRAMFHRDRQFRMLLRTLSGLGLDAELCDGTSLCAGGRKFSGNAFALRRTAGLHHGTFLLSSDLDALARALEPPVWSVSGRGVPSIRRPIVNLSQIAPEITSDRLMARLGEEFVAEWGDGSRPGRVSAETIRPAAVAANRAHWTSREWVWGQSPPACIRGEAVWPGGCAVSVTVQVTAGKVTRVSLTASNSEAPEAQVAEAWLGQSFPPEGLSADLPRVDTAWAGFLHCFLRGDVYDAHRTQP